eukprot:m.38259 g.38259  ORF g.38259 m.38259 type:complete len:391 (-) comp9413_c0_seq2:27-1199(-)
MTLKLFFLFLLFLISCNFVASHDVFGPSNNTTVPPTVPSEGNDDGESDDGRSLTAVIFVAALILVLAFALVGGLVSSNRIKRQRLNDAETRHQSELGQKDEELGLKDEEIGQRDAECQSLREKYAALEGENVALKGELQANRETQQKVAERKYAEELKYADELHHKQRKSFDKQRMHPVVIRGSGKKFGCPACDKRFDRKATCEAHIRVHTGERPFVCNSCNETFAQKSTLNRHNKKHTGVRKYSCEFCDKKFAENQNLKMHVKKIHGQYSHAVQSPDISTSSEGDYNGQYERMDLFAIESSESNAEFAAESSDEACYTPPPRPKSDEMKIVCRQILEEIEPDLDVDAIGDFPSLELPAHVPGSPSIEEFFNTIQCENTTFSRTSYETTV